jgi:hypothetical protein
MSEQSMSVEQINAHLAANSVTAAPAALTGADLCKVYNAVKPVLNFLLTILSLNPAWKAAVVALLAVLDKLCPGAAPAPAPTNP